MYDPVICLLAMLFPDQFNKRRDQVIDGLWNLVIPPALLAIVGVVVWLMLK
ncbi:MAG: hypothetical protein K2R98_02250 [Gemmataceae bacterium]|nr:hypothetical protein [Gemmataceae bacterium]